MNLKYLTSALLLFLLVISVGTTVASDVNLDNFAIDEGILKLNNSAMFGATTTTISDESLGWSVTPILKIYFEGSVTPLALHNGDKCCIHGDIPPSCNLQGNLQTSMAGEDVNILIDGKCVDTISLIGSTVPSDSAAEYYYTFHDLTPGEHTLTLEYKGHDYPGILPVPDIESCTYSCKINVFSSAADYQIHADNNVSVIADDTAIINGSLINSKGKYVPDASIEVYINNKFDSIIKTDSDGHFKYPFTSQNKGDYDVSFRYYTADGEIISSSSHVKVIRDDNLTMEIDPMNMSVKSGEVGMIHGTLLNKGKPMADVPVDVYINNRFIMWVKTDSEGHFSYPFSGDTGDYNVTFVHGTSQYGPIKMTSFVSVYD